VVDARASGRLACCHAAMLLSLMRDQEIPTGSGTQETPSADACTSSHASRPSRPSHPPHDAPSYLNRGTLTYSAPTMVADTFLGLTKTDIGAMTSAFPAAYGAGVGWSGVGRMGRGSDGME